MSRTFHRQIVLMVLGAVAAVVCAGCATAVTRFQSNCTPIPAGLTPTPLTFPNGDSAIVCSTDYSVSTSANGNTVVTINNGWVIVKGVDVTASSPESTSGTAATSPPGGGCRYIFLSHNCDGKDILLTEPCDNPSGVEAMQVRYHQYKLYPMLWHRVYAVYLGVMLPRQRYAAVDTQPFSLKDHYSTKPEDVDAVKKFYAAASRAAGQG